MVRRRRQRRQGDRYVRRRQRELSECGRLAGGEEGPRRRRREGRVDEPGRRRGEGRGGRRRGGGLVGGDRRRQPVGEHVDWGVVAVAGALWGFAGEIMVGMVVEITANVEEGSGNEKGSGHNSQNAQHAIRVAKQILQQHEEYHRHVLLPFSDGQTLPGQIPGRFGQGGRGRRRDVERPGVGVERGRDGLAAPDPVLREGPRGRRRERPPRKLLPGERRERRGRGRRRRGMRRRRHCGIWRCHTGRFTMDNATDDTVRPAYKVNTVIFS